MRLGDESDEGNDEAIGLGSVGLDARIPSERLQMTVRNTASDAVIAPALVGSSARIGEIGAATPA